MKKNEVFNPDYFDSSSDDNSHKHGCLPECKDMRKWNNTIQKMIDAFELLIDEDKLGIFTKDEEEAIEHGLELFGKYFRYLWD